MMTTRPITLGDLIEVMADAIGERPAFITDEREYSYAEIDERSTRLANHLVSSGVRPGDLVAVHATNCIEWVDAFYGAAKARAVPVNINYRYGHDELVHVYGNAQPVLAVVGSEFADAVEKLQSEVPSLREVLVIGEQYDAALAAASADRPALGRSSDDPYIVYTGGTTGLPKGVVWRQEDVIRGAMGGLRQGPPFDGLEELAAEAAADPQQFRLFSVGPLIHAGSQWMLGSCAVVGGIYVLYTHVGFDAHRVLDLLAHAQVQMLNLLGDAVARPIADALLAEPQRWDLSRLMVVANGAAPLSATVRADLRAVLPDCMLTDNYGSSETGLIGTLTGDTDQGGHPRFAMRDDVLVIDEEFRPCAVGEIGLVARSGHIPIGYFNDPERSAATFGEANGRRWAVTGDLARIEDDGTYTLLGRSSLVINSGGEKISPEEVEGALMGHPDVFDVAVIGTPHERWGQQVTALVQLRPGVSSTPAQLQDHCRAHLAGYKAPKTVVFVDQVPRTPACKVDYPEVSTLARQLLGVGSV